MSKTNYYDTPTQLLVSVVMINEDKQVCLVDNTFPSELLHPNETPEFVAERCIMNKMGSKALVLDYLGSNSYTTADVQETRLFFLYEKQFQDLDLPRKNNESVIEWKSIDEVSLPNGDFIMSQIKKAL
ncbi:MAG: NUDIX hydrolase [Patescibacteria group bacterium]|nr:NUDIX hydrolase [Patescibacteria group bacterium]